MSSTVLDSPKASKKEVIITEKPEATSKKTGGDGPEPPKNDGKQTVLELLDKLRLPDPVLKKYVLDKAKDEELENLKKADYLKTYPEDFAEGLPAAIYNLESKFIDVSFGEKTADYHVRFNLGPAGLYRIVMRTMKNL